eukprot:6755960-Pyramimonas_sp.AAC.1
MDFRAVAELHHRPGRSDEVASEREEKAAMSDSICKNHFAQRHPLLTPNLSVFLLLALASMSGCMCGHNYNHEVYERPASVRIAMQLALGCLPNAPSANPLDTDTIHD